MHLPGEVIEGFRKLPTGNVCDANGKTGNMDAGIKPIDARSKLVGPAVTVRSEPGDNLVLHQAIYAAAPGSVLVVDAQGYTGAGPFGDILASACIARGIAGVVLDGAGRDANDIEAMGFPFFTRGLNPGGTRKERSGAIDEPIRCGGVEVRPGDLVVADRDGVVVIEQEKVTTVLAAAQKIFDREIQVREALRRGETTIQLFGLDRLASPGGSGAGA